MIPVDQSTLCVWEEMGSGLGAALDQLTTFPVNWKLVSVSSVDLEHLIGY